MKLLKTFTSRLNTSISLNESIVVKKGNRYFLLNENLKELATRDFFYAGFYLGKIKNANFFPSFVLLKKIAEKKANKVIVNRKTEWLFICGRDVFAKGIIKVIGSKKKYDYALILNELCECLGFGKIMCNLNVRAGKIAVKNISDIGDFLRRERQSPKVEKI